jgi:signal transduction histidine kinase
MSGPESAAARPPAARAPLTRARIETMVSRAIVLFGLVFGVIEAPELLREQPALHQPLGWAQVAALCLALLWAVVAAVAQRGLRWATCAFAGLHLVLVALWPVTSAGTGVDGMHWLWTLCTVAAAYAAVGMPPRLAAAYAVLAPGLFGVVLWRLSGGPAWGTALLDAVYAALLGCVILAIAAMLRSSAGAVDAAQAAALRGYEQGLREHLGEAERVEIDALVHDSVLTTLLAAAAARTPEAQRLAARMAGEALGHLSATRLASAAPGGSTDAAALLARARSAAAGIAHPPIFRSVGPLAATLPENVAAALLAATVQAMQNSSQHAGGPEVARTVTVTGLGPGGAGGVRIEIADEGAGFVPARVAPGRLGLATSIVQRVELAGGAAAVETSPGAGCRITLSWPGPRAGAAAASARPAGEAT